MTIAASVAFGSRPSSGASSSMVASAAAAVTSDALCVRPPAARTTAVCDVPPPAGIAPNSAPPRLAAPVATSSRLASIGGSPGRANARPAAIDLGEAHQRDAERARQRAAATSARSGSVIDGSPCGIWPTVETPSACRPKNHDAAMPPPTATSGAGECGHRRSMPTSTTSVAAATASVSNEVSGRCCSDAEQVGEEALLGDVDAEQLGHLVEHDHEADAGLEAGQHRRGDEVGDEAETQQAARAAASRRPARSAWRSP